MDKFFKKSVLLLVLCLMGAVSAKAVDLGAIELGKVYHVDNFSTVTGTFTAPVTGTLLQDGLPEIYLEGVEQKSLNYGAFGQIVSYEVTEGVTYEIYGSFTMSGENVRWTMEGLSEVAVTEIDPLPGTQLSPSVNYTGDVLIYFSTRINALAAQLKVGETAVEATLVETGTTRLVVNVRDALNAMYANGTLDAQGGQDIQLLLTGVQTPVGVMYNGDGGLSIDYVAAPKAVSLVKTNFNNSHKLKSYYAENDPLAILEFEFDGELANDGKTEFIITCGNPEGENSYYYEAITPAIAGNKVTVDLSGKLRDLNQYLAMTDLKYIGLKLSNVRDIKGNIAAGDGNTSVGSYNYSFEYEYIEPVTISSEFIPANGASLDGVEEIEIWFNNSNMISFDGIKFSCADLEVVVPMSEIDAVVEGNDITIHVKVPEQIKGKKGITVTLNNMVSLDGYDHTRQVKAVYDTWVVTLVSPIQEGGAYATTGTDDFVFTVNKPYGYMVYDLYNGDEWVYGTQLYPAEDGTYTSYNGNWPLLADTDNYMIIRAWNQESDRWQYDADPVETTRLDFIGLTPGFTYSDVKFVSIDPEPNTTIVPTDNFCFTVTFDGLVEISDKSCINTGFGSSAKFDKIEAVDPEETAGLSNVWKLYPSASLLQGNGIDISIYAYDINGKLVEGNMGGKEYDYLQFSYAVYNAANYRPVSVTPADGAVVEELSSFVISYDNMAVGLNFSYLGSERPCIVNKFRETVYTFSDEDFVIDSPVIGTDELGYPIYSEITSVIMNMQTPITDEGSYTLIIPEDFFEIGSQFVTYGSEELTAVYTIEGSQSEDGVVLTLDPAPGTVKTIEKIEITADGIEDALAVSIEPITVTNADGELLLTVTADELNNSSFDWNSWSFLGFFIDFGNNPITTPGTYVVDIPAGMFEFLDMSSSAALTAVYTVSEDSAVKTLLIDSADKYDVYTVNGVKVMTTSEPSDLSTLRRGIYIINGKKVMVK